MATVPFRVCAAIAVEREDETTLERLLASGDFRALLAGYGRNFGDVSERQRSACVQVFP